MKVSVVLGSLSDLDKCRGMFELLDKFEIPYEKRVISAHRALDELIAHVDGFEERGVDLCIAVAGKAAHLPGVISGMTIRPVIGVPISGQATAGLDALLSVVQMPTGVPVATVALDGAKNAAVLAAEILAIRDEKLSEALKAYKVEMKEKVLKQDQTLRGEE